MLDFDKPMQFKKQAVLYGVAKIVKQLYILNAGHASESVVFLVEHIHGKIAGIQRLVEYGHVSVPDYIENVPPPKKTLWLVTFMSDRGEPQTVTWETTPTFCVEEYHKYYGRCIDIHKVEYEA